jgi:dCMP deaminase
MTMDKTIVAYVPVLHRGYLDFFKKFGEGNTLLIPDEEMTGMTEYIWRDMRALTQAEVAVVISSLRIFNSVKIADIGMVIDASRSGTIIMPQEDISFEIAKLLPAGAEVVFDPVFLRWNRFNVTKKDEVFWGREIEEADFSRMIMDVAGTERVSSSDWWRQIGAVAFNEKGILISAHNHHLPSELEPYYSGDPRTVFKQGEFIEYSTAVHAEADLVAKAANKGISLAGSELFVTTFPCPPCANLLSRTGIKTLYVTDGYSLLDAKRIFSESGIEIVRIIKKPSSV